MSIDRSDIDDDARRSASQLLARAAAALGRADRGLAQNIEDFFVPADARLDERTRAMLDGTLRAMVSAVEDDVRRQAARALTAAGDGDRARWLGEGDPVHERLVSSGLLRDPDLMRELIARTRQDVIADTLPPVSDGSGTASLLTRLTASADTHVAGAALALMTAEGRRRELRDGGRLVNTELPAELHHRLVWWVTAAIREQFTGTDADRALADAALRALGRHDEGDRIESTAMHLASAIDAQPAELAALLVHALGDRSIALFIALLALPLRLDFAVARHIVVGADNPLWLSLRAIELDRATIARIGLALSGDVESFADQLDAIAAITSAEARAVLAPLALPSDFRAAITALAAAK